MGKCDVCTRVPRGPRESWRALVLGTLLLDPCRDDRVDGDGRDDRLDDDVVVSQRPALNAVHYVAMNSIGH